MEREIKYLGKNEKLIKFFSESEDVFEKRLGFIKKLEKDKIEFKLSEKYSKVWSNIKFTSRNSCYEYIFNFLYTNNSYIIRHSISC